MVALRYTIGQDTLSLGLRAARDRAANLEPAMAAIAAYMLSETQQRFLDQKGPDGEAWLPSAAAKAEGRQTLIKSTRLLDSIISRHDSASAEVGTNVIYAAIHNFGGIIRGRTRPDRTTAPLRTPFGPRASVNMPQRQFIGFSEDDKTEIKGYVERHIKGEPL